MAEGPDNSKVAAPPRPGEQRSEWDPITGGIRCVWWPWQWSPCQLVFFGWLLLQSMTIAAALAYGAVQQWAAGEVPVKASVVAAASWAPCLCFVLLLTRQIQGRGKRNELHASPDGFLYILPTGWRRRTYIPREYIRDVRVEGYFSSLTFREWRLCIELTTPCVPLNFPPKRYTLWTSKRRSYLEVWAKVLRRAMNIQPANGAASARHDASTRLPP
jgi:hypothetical protein